ncbi:AMP-binding enzyme family protein [Mycobacterium xenopi 4042]|uniref:AMP-binding enzyme family protein n=1 Tax=Mycobacterium xenopi 4042 TaxID=1299334 RepID=X8AH12_MYCXE|nr:AMP-binding enzyme family protein [Mycobacterium xenopi 4042]
MPAELVERYQREGWWTPHTLGDVLARGLGRAAHTEFRVHSAVRPWTGKFRDVEAVARRLAGGLRARGVGPGDVVAFQLPNWMEAAAVFWAAAFLGAVVVPIVHFYGRKELSHILSTARPCVFVTAEQFGPMCYQPDLAEAVPIVGVVGRDFDELLALNRWRARSPPTRPPGGDRIYLRDDQCSQGVIHTHQTLGCETRQLFEGYPPNRGRQLTAAPVGHFIGMLSAFLVPVLESAAINLCDAWEPNRVLALMKSDGLAIGGGPPYFFTSVLDHPDFTEEHLRSMRTAGLGGAAIPAAVARRLADNGIHVFRSYGSTEHPSVTLTPHDAPAEKRLFTDGLPRPGVEIRLAEDGEIISRGPDLCLGYTDETLTARAFDAEGWYRTGDVGVLDDDGYLTVTDRKADIIIRGGENISALEVEEVLLAMPAVAEAAVVAAPDARLGEHAAAVLRIRPGYAMPTLAEIREHFDRMGVARQKWPEELHQVDDYPRTASGKVQKQLVREGIAVCSNREYHSPK